MPKNVFIKTTTSILLGGIFYCIFVILLNYFAPITGIIAGFVSGIGIVIISKHINNNNNNNIDISPINLLYFTGVAIISLIFGFIFIYYLKTEIIHGMKLHPKDFITLMDFLASTFKIPDILSTIIGGLLAFSLSNKISAIYIYLRLTPSV